MTFEDDLVISLWLNSTRSVWSHFISDLLAGWLFQVGFISKQRPPNIWGDLKCIGRETLYSEQQILKSSKVFIERIGSHVGFISKYNPQKKYFQLCVLYLSRNQPFLWTLIFFLTKISHWRSDHRPALRGNHDFQDGDCRILCRKKEVSSSKREKI